MALAGSQTSRHSSIGSWMPELILQDVAVLCFSADSQTSRARATTIYRKKRRQAHPEMLDSELLAAC